MKGKKKKEDRETISPTFLRNPGVVFYINWDQSQVISKLDVTTFLEVNSDLEFLYRSHERHVMAIETYEAQGLDYVKRNTPKNAKKGDIFRHKITVMPLGVDVWISDVPFPEDWKAPGPNVQKNLIKFKGNRDIISFEVPKEIQQMILMYLSVSEVNAVSMLSQHWHSVANSNIVWKSCCLRIFPDDSQFKVEKGENEAELQEQLKLEHTLITHWDIHSNEEVENWKNEYIARLAKYKIERQRQINLHESRMHHRYWMMCGVHMFHKCNGRNGFDALGAPELPAGYKIPPIETVKQMLVREDQLRLSPAIQARFADSNLDAILIAEDVQIQVAKEFGFNRDPQNVQLGVDLIRSAPALYPDHPEIKRIPHYLKYNRSKMGTLEVGDIIPDVPLHSLSTKPITLYSKLRQLHHSLPTDSLSVINNTNINNNKNYVKPVVIACGSYS